MEWLLIFFYVGDCEVGPANIHRLARAFCQMVSMLSFPTGVGIHGVGNWSAGKVTPLLITVLLGKKTKQNKTNKLAQLVVISVKHWWSFYFSKPWLPWSISGWSYDICLDEASPLTYRATESGNNCSQFTGKRKREKMVHFNVMLKSLKLEAGEDWNSSLSSLWTKSQTSPNLPYPIYKAYPSSGSTR